MLEFVMKWKAVCDHAIFICDMGAIFEEGPEQLSRNDAVRRGVIGTEICIMIIL